MSWYKNNYNKLENMLRVVVGFVPARTLKENRTDQRPSLFMDKSDGAALMRRTRVLSG